MNRNRMSNPTLSVIIPTKNRPADLKMTCETIFRQTALPDQLIVLDQSLNPDGKVEIEALHAIEPNLGTELVYILDPSVRGLSEARNRAMELATSEVWLFLDDDVLLEPGFLKELLETYTRYPDAVGVSGTITNYVRPSWIYRAWCSVFMRGSLRDDRQPVYWNAAGGEAADPVRVTRMGGGLMSFRAQAIRDLRFDENLRGVCDGEDVDFCARLGPDALMLINPRARLIHNQSVTGREQSHWLRRHARGNVYLYRRNWNRQWTDRLCIAWLNVGYLVMAALASVRRGSSGPWKELQIGRREGLSAAQT